MSFVRVNEKEDSEEDGQSQQAAVNALCSQASILPNIGGLSIPRDSTKKHPILSCPFPSGVNVEP